MSRATKGNWLQTYRDYINNQEAPDIYHLWIGLTVISATLRRHVWIDRGAYKIYPNLYVFLVAASASCRKSVAMELGLDLLSPNEDIKIVHERTTLEGLMDLMDRVEILPNGRLRPDGSVVLHADELSNLFGKASYITDLVSFLTAAYTSKAKLEFLTRNKGYVKVRNPCPVVIAGTTPEQMKEIFPSLVLFSGFIGRAMLIYAERGKKIARVKLKTNLREALIRDLFLMSQLDGEVKLTDECEEFFDDWYENKMGTPESKDQASFFERKHDHALKTAMLFSLSESDDMIITKDHLIKAIQAVNLVEDSLPKAVSYIGAVERSDLMDIILSMIKKNEPVGIAHTTLLKRLRKQYKDSKEFSATMDTLIEAKLVEPEARQTGLFYKIKDEEE